MENPKIKRTIPFFGDALTGLPLRFIFAFIILPIFIWGQSTINVLPSTPEAANFEKYGNIPVSNFTGVPQISVPIHTIELKNISIPINLSYHSSGIKVDETASNVGLGWVLNAGGLVSVNTRGNPDFDTYGFVNAGNPSQLLYDRYIVGAFQEEQINDDIVPNNDHTLLDNIASGQVDGEPDLFHFRFPTGSGKFVYDETLTPRTIPFRAIKIERINAGAGFQITDENGNIFEFSERETSLMRPAPGSDCDLINPLYPSASVTPTWHLSKITTPHNDTVTFYYDTISYAYEYIASQQDFILENDPFGNVPAGCQQRFPIECKNIIDVLVGKRLSSIISSDGTEISFGYDTTDRLDLNGTNRLSQIQLFHNTLPIDTWELDHDYFTSGNCTPLTDECYRLKLTQLTRNGHPPHQFLYDEANTLPKRNSFSQDHWGFYNGKNNSTFLPATIHKGTNLPGADRSPDFNFTKSGILNRVIYPTGGETLFEYGPNEYWFDGTEVTYQTKSSQTLSINGTSTGSPISTQFTVSGSEDVFGTLTFECSGGNYCTNPSSVPPGDLMVARVQGNGIDIAYDFPHNPSPHGNETPVILPPGTYTLSLFASVSGFYGSTKLEWVEETQSNVQENRIGGGIRIERITNKRLIGEDLVKEFVYTDISQTSRSSGFVSHGPKYTSLVVNRFIEEIPPAGYRENVCTYFSRGSHNLANTSSINGGSVGYEYVSVLEGLNGSNGKTITRYTTFQDSGQDILTWPFVPPTNYDVLRGLPIEETIYKNNSGAFEKVRESSFNYDYRHGFNGVFENGSNENNILGLKITTLRPYWNNGGTLSELSILDVGAYWTVANWYSITGKTEKFYGSDSGSPFLTRTTVYDYDNPVHGLVTHTILDASDGNTIETFVSYPDDIGSTGDLGLPNLSNAQKSEIDKLKSDSDHRVAFPIQTTTVVNGNKTLERKVLDDFGNGIIMPSRIDMLKGDQGPFNNLQNEVQFLSYDDNANPLEVKRENSITTSYIWGYDKKYVIAKIDNASYSDIAAALGITISQLKGYDEANISAIDGLRTDATMSNTMITTYVYNPLIGISTMTDPRGYTTQYEYDGLNRLKSVKDEEGNFISDHNYHYKGQ